MKSYNKIKSMCASAAAVIIVMIMTFTGCTTTADYTLGEEFAPSNQQMVMRTRSYKAGVMREAEQEETPCRIFETRLFRTDSVKSNDVKQFVIGVERDERFGVRRMGFVSQFLHMILPDDSIGFGYRPIYDSMVMQLLVDTFAGDTTKPIKFNVYWLEKELVADGATDTVFYTSFDARKSGHIKADAEPIFTFTFPDPENNIYTDNVNIRMKETPATKDFINRLLCMDKLDENGLANNNVEVYRSDSLFLKTFKGVWVEPAEDNPEDAAVYSLSIPDTNMRLFGRVRNAGADADIVTDTLDISYVFRNTYSGDWGNVWAQSVKHDYSTTQLANLPMDETLDERAEVQIAYVDGCGGVVTELYFTDEFLLSLRDINSDDDDYISAAINQAQLKFYLEESDYDYAKLDPLALADAMNKAVPRLGLYTDYKKLTPVLDYMFEQEKSGTTIHYNGYLNRSRAMYEMNISAYIQELMNALLALEPDANGNVDLTKLLAPRTIYIAPEAYDQFTLSRSILQGSNHELNNASIELELTYTLVK